MPPDPQRETPPRLVDRAASQSRSAGRRTKTNNTGGELEALVFSTAARTWLDHLLVGDIEVVEGVDAASLLLGRARQLAVVA